MHPLNRNLFFFALWQMLFGCVAQQASPQPTKPFDTAGYRLVWADEFNGSAVDTTAWTFETGNSGWGNNEHQFYTAANATVKGGSLLLTAKKEKAGTASYTSARMKTQGRKSFLYGRFEAGIRISPGQGLWPAFWMLGESVSTLGWPGCGEIDIMEHINADSLFYGTAHWDKSGHVSSGGKAVFDPAAYHVYDVEWTKDTIAWHVDGITYHRLSITNSTGNVFPFHSPFFILLNFAVGGNWPGHTVDDAKLPAIMYVDYVRVYQRK